MPVSARTASNDAVNCPARSQTKNRNQVTRSPRSITRLRICWVVHRQRLGAQELPPGHVGVPDQCWSIRTLRRTRRIVDAGDPVADLEQLALDPAVSPALVLPGHALDQHGHSVPHGWTPETGWIRPYLGNQATMPAQDRAWRDQSMPAQDLRQPADQRGEDRSIRPVQARGRAGSAQHGDFMPQHQEFDVLGRRRSAKQQQQVQQPQEDQIQKTQGPNA
jgi:hypothetical protein